MKPLLHPATDDLRPEAILHALADRTRAALFAEIVRTDGGQACSAVVRSIDRSIPKSSLSNHFSILREAGLVRCERQGVEMHAYSRRGEIEARYPGLLSAILDAYCSATPAQ